MSIDPKSRVLLGLAIDVRRAARALRLAKTSRERNKAQAEVDKATAEALRFIKKMLTGASTNIDETALDTLARYCLGNILLTTLPDGRVKVDPFKTGPEERASMSDGMTVPADAMIRANRIIQMAAGQDEHSF